jgi:hypothetical protein
MLNFSTVQFRPFLNPLAGHPLANASNSCKIALSENTRYTVVTAGRAWYDSFSIEGKTMFNLK